MSEPFNIERGVLQWDIFSPAYGWDHLSSARVTALAEGSWKDATMVISVRNSKAMHVHSTRRVGATTEKDVAALSLAHKWESCSGREFKTAKRRVAEATLHKVSIGDDVLENVLNFEYLNWQQTAQCDGDDQLDVRHRMDIAMDWPPPLPGD